MGKTTIEWTDASWNPIVGCTEISPGLFHESVYGDWIDQVIKVIDKCPQHTFQILTKRAQRMHDLLRHYPMNQKNIWLGVSVENQHFADERIPLLLQTPAAVRWISAEPLLGPACIKEFLYGTHRAEKYRPPLNWVVCGGESGPHARPMHPNWARSLRDQCQAAGVPFFFKQWGNWSPHTRPDEDFIKKCRSAVNWKEWPDGTWMHEWGKKLAGRLLDGREWSEYPCAR